MKSCFAVFALLLSGCVHPVDLPRFARETPEMRPEVFFAGASHGEPVLHNPRGKPVARMRVDSFGTRLADGSFRLDQTITDAKGKVSTRFWIMTPIDAHRYRATLSDAAGPVSAEAYGNVFHLRYRFKKPFVMIDQWLYLQSDGRTVLNEGVITMPGRVIARLSEVITRDP